MTYGCISHVLTLAGTVHRRFNMISAYTSKERSSPYQRNKARSRAQGGPSDHSHSSKDALNNGTPRSSFNDLMRPRHPLVFLSSFTLHHVTLRMSLCKNIPVSLRNFIAHCMMTTNVMKQSWKTHKMRLNLQRRSKCRCGRDERILQSSRLTSCRVPSTDSKKKVRQQRNQSRRHRNMRRRDNRNGEADFERDSQAK